METISIVGINNPLVAAVVGAAVGTISTWLAQYFSSQRGLFTYLVEHFPVGLSLSDPALGTITVNWNGNSVNKLFLSTMQLKNNSFRDYENVQVRVYTGDAIILTDSTEIIGTTRVLKWTDEFLEMMLLKHKSEAEMRITSSRREYEIPTMNRGQEIRFTILNTPAGNNNPTLWIDILHKGIKIKYSVPQNETLGVPTALAAVYGFVLSVIFFAVTVSFVDTTWVAAALCTVFGLTATLLGIFTIKAYRHIRSWIGG